MDLLPIALVAAAAAFVASMRQGETEWTVNQFSSGGYLWSPKLMNGGDWNRKSALSDLSADGRKANARVILEEWRKAGYPIGIALAALANARSESDLDHTAVGDNGSSIGLFQLHERGHGAGMSESQRKDPRLNTRGIIEAYKSSGGAVAEAYEAGERLDHLAYLFSRDVERAVRKGNDNARAFTKVLLPTLYSVPARDIR